MSTTLRLHARIDALGLVRATWLVIEDNAMRLRVDVPEGDLGGVDAASLLDEQLLVPTGAIDGIFARYGKPLEEPAGGAHTDTLLGEETGFYREPQGDRRLDQAEPELQRLRTFRFRGFGSVHASDWVAWERSGVETLAVPAPLFAAALTALARAAAKRQNP